MGRIGSKRQYQCYGDFGVIFDAGNSYVHNSKFLPPQICNIILEMSFEELMHAAFRILIFLVRPLRPTLPNAHECFIALIK